jgi:DNA-directed RNA polymerase subunit N
MIIPVRCLSCGKPIGQFWETYKKRVLEDKEDAGKVLDELGLERYCCRAVFLGHADMLPEITKFKKA